MKAILIGILSSIFFSVTFILNRSMELSGGSWLWSSSLRYFFMIPFLIVIVLIRGNLKELFLHMKNNPSTWFLWSIVGFGLFYAPITYAAASGAGWLVAGTWQFTIIAGSLLAPLFFDKKETIHGTIKVRNKIPVKGLGFSLLIFIGIIIIQLQESGGGISANTFLLGVLPVMIAAFAYPLGNRKMMEHCKGKIDTFQRVLGMTLASMPLWIVLSVTGFITVGPPSGSQLIQSLVVAISSGVIATVLFFFATELVKEDQGLLAGVEATQASQIMFVMIGEILFLQEAFPSTISICGICLIIIGMMLHSFSSRKKIVIHKEEAASI